MDNTTTGYSAGGDGDDEPDGEEFYDRYHLEIDLANGDLDTLLRVLSDAFTVRRLPSEASVRRGSRDGADGTVDVVIASALSERALEVGLETLNVVESATVSECRGEVPNTEAVRSAAAPEASPMEEFKRLQGAIEAVEYEDLVRDPSYLELLSDADALSAPEDEVDYDELLSIEPDEDAPDDGDAADPDGSTAVDRLIEDLRGDDVTAEQRATLRNELGVTSPTSLEVRVNHIQSQLEEFHAYVDALESFLDEYGTASNVLDELRRQYRAVEDELDKLRAAIDDVRSECRAVADDVESLETDLEEVDRLRDRLEGLDAELEERDELLKENQAELAEALQRIDAELEQRAAELRSDQRSLERRVEETEAWRERVSDAFQQ